VRGNENVPIVNPVRDSLETKTDESTTSVATAVYYPAHYRGTFYSLDEILEEFCELITYISEKKPVFSIF